MKRKHGASPPPTPASELPGTRKGCRFAVNGFASEWSESYRPSGFHPVHIDDEFNDGRYRILRKLGNGSYSTVWLAADATSGGFVALKMLRAKESGKGNSEKLICQYLASKAENDSLAARVVNLIDNFEITGPNGTHLCLVFEPMGPSSASMASALPCNKSLPFLTPPRYPIAMAKMMLRHALSGITFLHKHGITHGDMQPGNLLLFLPGLDNKTNEELRQDQKTLSEPLRRLDGKLDLWAPKYLALAQPLHAFTEPESRSTTVKVSDLGAAFWTANPPSKTVTPLRLRAPELIFCESFGSPIDIWAFGCLIYEFSTGRPLIAAAEYGNREEDRQDADDDHILELIDVLGPLPDRLMTKWSRRDKWIGPNGGRLQPTEDHTNDELDAESDDEPSEPENEHDSEEVDELENGNNEYVEEVDGPAPFLPQFDGEPALGAGEPFVNKPLEQLFAENKPEYIDDEEARVITKLIREVLQYEPGERPTAEQLLKHSWLQEGASKK